MPDSSQHSAVPPRGWRGVVANVALPLVVLGAALGVGAMLISSPPVVPRSERETPTPVVGVQTLVLEDTTVYVEAFGTVRPAREVSIAPESGGRIIELNPRLEPGGLIAAGELLFAVEPADYHIAVAQAEAGVTLAEHEGARIQARIDGLRARGRQLDLEIEYLQWNADRLDRLAERDTVAEFETRDAVTRLESQKAARMALDAEIAEQEEAVEIAVAGVNIARRRLEAARLALERTRVPAPFEAIVLSESVEYGQLVQAQAPIARLACTAEFWVEAAIPVARLADIRFASEAPAAPSQVTVNLATGAHPIVRQGTALRSLGTLDPQGRMARVLVSVRDPLGLEAGAAGAADAILIGSYVRLRIESALLRDVYSVPRKALRENDRVWVRDVDGLLAIRPVEIVWRRADDILVRDGFEPGDQLVVTHLASVVPGMPVRVRDAASPAADGGDRGVEAEGIRP